MTKSAAAIFDAWSSFSPDDFASDSKRAETWSAAPGPEISSEATAPRPGGVSTVTVAPARKEALAEEDAPASDDVPGGDEVSAGEASFRSAFIARPR
jgi:hypothetical protein